MTYIEVTSAANQTHVHETWSLKFEVPKRRPKLAELPTSFVTMIAEKDMKSELEYEIAAWPLCASVQGHCRQRWFPRTGSGQLRPPAR
jgi:hypothetical protein